MKTRFFVLSVFVLSLLSSFGASTNLPVQYTMPDYQLLTTNFFRSNFFLGSLSTNMAITYDKRGRPTLWLTNIASAGGSGEVNYNGEISATTTNATSHGLVHSKVGVTNLLRTVGPRYGLLGTNEGGTNISLAVNPAVIASQTDLANGTNGLDAARLNLIAATNALHTRAGNLEGATNGLTTRAGLLETRATNLEAATNILDQVLYDLIDHVDILDAIFTDDIAELQAATNVLNVARLNLTAATNALDTARLNLNAATNAIDTRVTNLEGATNGLRTDVLSLQSTTNTTNIASRLGVPYPPSSGGFWIVDEEFLGNNTSFQYGKDAWGANVNGGGVVTFATNIAGALGIKELIVTNASDRAGMTLQGAINGATNMELWCQGRVAIGTLDTAGTTNQFQFGISDGTTGDGNNSIFWMNNSNAWYASASRGGTRTRLGPFSNSVADAWIEIAWHLNSNMTNIDFYMGATPSTLVFQTNINNRAPNISGLLLAVFVKNQKMAGVTERMTNYVDNYKMWARRL